MGKVAGIVVQMARKLTDDNARLGRVRNAGKPKTFPHFREIRNAYLDIQGLVFSIQERLQEAGDDLPSNFPQWVIHRS